VVNEPVLRRPVRVAAAQRTGVRAVRAIALGSAALTLSFAAAHAIELPNKLQLDGPLWLAVQQQLYRGWDVWTAPCEIGAILASCTLVYLVRGRRPVMVSAAVAATCMAIALLLFAGIVAPVDTAVQSWTAATLPATWPAYRLRWEIGHAITAGLALTAVIAVLRTAFADASARRA
jgi:hypothetical protein